MFFIFVGFLRRKSRKDKEQLSFGRSLDGYSSHLRIARVPLILGSQLETDQQGEGGAPESRGSGSELPTAKTASVSKKGCKIHPINH